MVITPATKPYKALFYAALLLSEQRRLMFLLLACR